MTLMNNTSLNDWIEGYLIDFLNESKERNLKGENIPVYSVTNKDGFVLQTDKFARAIHSINTKKYKVFRKHCFGYNPARINVGSIAINEEDSIGLLSPMYVVFNTKQNLSPLFLKYWVQTKDFNNDVINNTAGSVRESLNFSGFKHFKVNIPKSFTEQLLISEILQTTDDVINNIDKLIKKNENIHLGLLQDLFKYGIDENGQVRNINTHKFKHSVIGLIPADWEVKQLIEIYEIPSRNGLYKPASFYGSGYKMIHMPQMFKGIMVDTSEASKVNVTQQEYKRYSLKKDDILFARRSLSFEGAGLCAIVPEINEPLTFESSIIRVRVNPKLMNPHFVMYFLRSPQGYQLRRPFIREVAVSGVSSEDIEKFSVPCPTIKEQERVALIINAQISTIISLQQEKNKYLRIKIGLLNNLLTGKVRTKHLVS